MVTSPSNPPSNWRPDKYVALIPANDGSAPVSYVGAYLMDPVTGAPGADLSNFEVAATGSDAPRTLANRFGEVFNVKDYGAVGDNVSDDSAAIQDAIDAAEAAGGGVVFFPAPDSRYKCNSTLSIDSNGVRLAGVSDSVILDFSSQASGPAVAFGGVFDWGIENLTILNSYGAGLELNRGTVTTGPQTYCAYGSVKNVNIRGARVAADNVEIGKCYMTDFTNLRSQDGVRKGIAVYGFCTSLTFTCCHSLDAADDGWQLKNIMYSQLVACGADGSGGYGYSLQDAQIMLSGCGAESNDYGAMEFVYDSTSTSTKQGLNLTIDALVTIGNNVGAHSGVGFLGTFTASPASTLAAGMVEFRNWRELGSPSGNACEGSGAFRVIADQRSRLGVFGTNGMTWGSSAGFIMPGDGVTDISYPLPITTSGTTRIAQLAAKLRNGIADYGGLIIVHVSQNNRSTPSRAATYVLLVTRASAGTTAEIKTLSSTGNDDGSNAADASFTFTFDATSNELRATVAGSTADGNWYFQFSVIGNLNLIPG